MFEFKTTFDDEGYLQFNQYHLVNSYGGKKQLMVFRLTIPFLCFIFIVALFMANADFLLIAIEAIVLTILSILWIIFSKKMLFISMKSGIKNYHKKHGRLPYSKEAILKFDDEIIHEITPDIEAKMKYSQIEKIALTEKAIYLYFSYSQAFILPLNAFSEEMEKLKFLDFISSKVDILKDTKKT